MNASCKSMRKADVYFHSRRRRSYCSDPPTTEPQRPRRQGSHCREAMGAGQHYREFGRVMGWTEAGAYTHDFSLVHGLQQDRALTIRCNVNRAEENTKTPSTSSKNSHKLPLPHPFRPSLHKPYRSCTLAGPRRHRLRLSKPHRRIQATSTPSPTRWYCK